MKFKMRLRAELESNDPGMAKKVLDPENETPDRTEITTTAGDSVVSTEIEGEMSVGTALRSLDDIIQTVVLSQDVAQSAQRPDQIE